MTNSPSPKDRSAALQALASLGAISKTLQVAAQALTDALGDTRSLDELLSDPDSPVNVRATLDRTRAAATAYRAALQPFARAYSRKMEPLTTPIPIFIDPKRPELNRFVSCADVREASRVFFSSDIGAQSARRLRLLEALCLDTISTIRNVLSGGTTSIPAELSNLLARAEAYSKGRDPSASPLTDGDED